MKTIVILWSAFVSLLAGPISASAQIAPGLEASDPRWGSAAVVNVMAHSYPVDRGQATNYPSTDEVSALFRNVGRKAIRSVTWKYVFYQDEERTVVLASYKFGSSVKLEPGASARLKEVVFASSEPRTWTNYHRVSISRIKYADGTVWQADSQK